MNPPHVLALEQAVTRRQIRFAWHFTRVENVSSILRNGLIPRSDLARWGIGAMTNDQYRYDRQPTANCISIGHPNYKMFYQLRMENRSAHWVVVALRPKLLWELDCAFCHENAASNNVTCNPITSRKGLQAFERMFVPVPGKPSRNELKIPDFCPTHPQAEILVFDRIEPAYIIGAVCEDQETARALKAHHADFEFIHEPSLFSARVDYLHWR